MLFTNFTLSLIHYGQLCDVDVCENSCLSRENCSWFVHFFHLWLCSL